MPLGRPRSKRKKPTCPQRPVTHAVSRENSTSPTNRVASSPESHGDIATVQPAQFTFLTQLRSGQDGGLPYCTPMTGSDRIDQMYEEPAILARPLPLTLSLTIGLHTSYTPSWTGVCLRLLLARHQQMNAHVFLNNIYCWNSFA